jgi:hypothetical protein
MRAAAFAELSAPAGKLFAASQLSLSKARAIGAEFLYMGGRPVRLVNPFARFWHAVHDTDRRPSRPVVKTSCRVEEQSGEDVEKH